MRTLFSLLTLVVTLVMPLGVLFVSFRAHAEAVPLSKSALEQFTTDAMRAAVEELSLTAPEKKIFDTEVTNDSALVQTFVSNYRDAGDATVVQIDKPKLKNYLKFQSKLFLSPKATGVEPKICVFMRASPKCSACGELRSFVGETLSAKLEKRGFRTTRTLSGVTDESELSGEAAFDESVNRAAETGCDGTLYTEIRPEHSADSVDESDDPSADLGVETNTYFALRDQTGRKIKSKGVASAQVPGDLKPDSSAKAIAQNIGTRVMTDVFAGAASQAALGGASLPGKLAQNGEDHYLRLEGVTSFELYSKFKQLATENLPELRLEERIISPGVFQFQASSDADLVSATAKLKTLNWNGRTLEVLRSGSQEAAVVLR